jgi:hypothetical protein
MTMKNTKSKKQLVLAAVLAVSVLAPVGAMAAPLDELANNLSRAGATWGPALLVLGALIAGGSIVLGHHQSGDKVKNFLLGAIFLVFAAGGSAFIYAAMKNLVGN